MQELNKDVFDCSKDEWEDPEKETPIYFLDTILDELIFSCGLEEVRMGLDELTCKK